MHAKAMDAAVATVAENESIATLLLLASEIAGSNVALLARISDDVWTVCAAHEFSAVGGGADYQVPLGRPVRVRVGLKAAPISIAVSGPQSCESLTASAIACEWYQRDPAGPGVS